MSASSVKRCADVTFDMRDEHYGESPVNVQIGDLVWHPKMRHGGHVIAGESEPRSYGWEEPWTTPICQCGDVDLDDHHVVVLARPAPEEGGTL